MRIIGIDPGIGIIGWSVIEKDFSIKGFGVVTTEVKTPVEDRLHNIFNEFETIIRDYSPQCAALERLFFAKNSTTALDVSKAIGVILLVLRQNNIPFTEYTPPQIKKAITGHGGATKDQIQRMTMRLFGLPCLPTPDDAADALAIAACHSFSI